MVSKKRIISIIAVVTLLITVIVVPIVGNESNHTTLTLKSLEERIVSDSLSIKKATEDVASAKGKSDLAESNKSDSGSSIIETKKNKKYYPVEAQMNYLFAQETLEGLIESEVLSGTKLYYDYFNLLKEIEVQQSKVNRLKVALDAMNTKVALGTATKNDSATADLEVQKASYTLMTLMNDRTSMFLDLNMALNYELDAELVLEPQALPFEAYELNSSLDEHIEYVLATNSDLKKLRTQLDLLEIEIDIYKDHNSRDAYDSTISGLRDDIDDKIYSIADKERSLEYDVRSKYNSILNTYESFEIKGLELMNLELQLEVLQKRFDVGLVVGSSVELAKENVAFAKLAIEKAKVDYFVAVESYDNFLE